MLTSSNHDGAEGLQAIKRAGGIALVQDPSTAESPIGPRAAIAAGPVDAVLNLDEIAQFICERCRRPQQAESSLTR
jgi:two-component system chemotaxis response regulator CheB